MKQFVKLLLLLLLLPAIVSAGDRDPSRNPNPRSGLRWYAHHERGDFSEYYWRHPDTPCGWLVAITDPTSSGRGYVAESQILCGQGTAHRLYPTVNLEQCYYGSYYSAFDVWLSASLDAGLGWISLATYSNAKNWQDLFGVNLSSVDGQAELSLFHVPNFGQGIYTRVARRHFPMKQWVRIEVAVSDREGIRVFQDGMLVLKAEKDWGAAGPSICEAHWGLYAEGSRTFVHMLNDNILLESSSPLQ